MPISTTLRRIDTPSGRIYINADGLRTDQHGIPLDVSLPDFRSGDYGGGEPNWTPAGSAGQAIDTSNERVWQYYSGAWH